MLQVSPRGRRRRQIRRCALLSAHALCAAGVAWIGGGRDRHAASTGQQLRFGPKTTVATLERAARKACYRRRRILRRWRIYALRKLLLPQVRIPQSAATASMTWLLLG